MNAPFIPDTGYDAEYRNERFSAPTAFATVAKSILLRAIEHCNDPADQKGRIMLAREHGHLSDAEARALIVKYKLEDA